MDEPIFILVMIALPFVVLFILGCIIASLFKLKNIIKEPEEAKNKAIEKLNNIIEEFKNYLEAAEQNESFEIDRAEEYRPGPSCRWANLLGYKETDNSMELDNSTPFGKVKRNARLLKDQKPLLDYCKEKSRNFLAINEYKKALIYLDFASSLGDIEAMYNLGVCYFNGLGVKKDENEGTALLFAAAELEYRLAIDKLGSTQTTENVQNFFYAFCKFSVEAKSNLISCVKNVGDKRYPDKAAILQGTRNRTRR